MYIRVIVALILAVFCLCDVDTALAAVVAPTLQSPLNGEEIDDSPEFAWYSPYDETAANYRIQISTNPNFTSEILYDKVIYFNHFEDGYEIYTDSSGQEISIVNNGSNLRIVYWRIATFHKTLGASSWSATGNFIQYPTVPGTPSLSSPTSGAGVVKSATINLVWKIDIKANDYFLQVATEQSFQDTVFSGWVGNISSYNIASKVNSGVTYYWRVRAKNISGVSDNYSSVSSFTVSCDATIQNLKANPSIFDPFKGQNTMITAALQGVSFSSGTALPSWRIEVGDSSFSGQGVAVTSTWNGKSYQGKLLQPDTYTAKLVVTAADGCSATASIPITLTMDSTQTSDTVKLSYEDNTQDPTSINTCLTSQESGSTTSIIKGDITHSQLITSLKGVPLPVELVLTYNSQNGRVGPLGLGWSHNYDIRLSTNSAGSVTLHGSSGLQRLYTKTATTTYKSPQGDISTLIRDATTGNYKITERGVTQNFNANGRLTSIVDRFGNTITMGYDVSNPADLKTITDSAGRTIRFEYDTAVTPHRIMRITDPNAGPTTDDIKKYKLCYDAHGQLFRITDPLTDKSGYWEYLYYTMPASDDYRNGMLRSRQDPNGNVTLYEYYPDGRLSVAIDPEGITNPANHNRKFTYNNETGTVKSTILTEKDGGQWKYEYDTQTGVLLKSTNPQDKSTKYTYYPVTNWIKSKTEPFGYSASLGRQVELTTFYTYDSYGNLLTQTDPADLAIYTPPVTPEAIAAPATLASLSPPIKPALRYAYDHSHYDRLTSANDERGSTPLTTTYTYSTENGGEVVTVTAPGNIVTITKYHPNGAVKEVIDANNKSTIYTYYPDDIANRGAGKAGLLLTVSNSSGITTTVTTYDKNGNSLEARTKDTSGVEVQALTQEFDALNRLRKTSKKALLSTDNLVSEYYYDYDKVGNLSFLKDLNGYGTLYEYNYNRQLKKTTDTKQNVTILNYSGSGCGSCGGAGVDKLIEVRDAKQAQNSVLAGTNYKYDVLGHLEYETDPLGKKIRYTYYDNGLVKEKYDATAATPGKLLVTYLYNNMGQVTDKTFTDGTYEKFIYYPDGKLWTASNQNISYTYSYYASGRLESVTDTNNNRISYDLYDGLGQRKQVTILKGAGGDQRIINYDYDSANRPWNITSSAGKFTYVYDKLGRRDTLTYPNGTQTDWDFNDLDWLTAITHKLTGGYSFAAFNYTIYDKVGNRKTITGNTNETYGYDELYRLLTVTSTKPETFNYDAVGNRQNGPGPDDTVYVHNNANQMTTGRKLAYGYDNFGNQTTKTVPGTSDKSWLQTWDYQNRLIKLEKSKGTEKRIVAFKYDPLGHRIDKQMTIVKDGITKTQRWSYVYDGDNIAVEIYTDENNSTTKTYYTHGPGVDEHLALERGGQFYYYHADGLGSIAAITNAAPAVVQSYEYDSYGMATPSMDFRNDYTYTGREWDKETGLYYYRARYYDPIDGIFISKDPIGFRGGDVNLYAYVQNNPINWRDPSGLFVFGKRPLSDGKAPWIPGGSSNPLDDYFNTEISHEHGFFEDGSGDNIGFSPNGRFSEDPTGKGYHYDNTHYDDATMREALKNVTDGDYSLLGGWNKKKNNCQDWADRLRNEYNRIKRK